MNTLRHGFALFVLLTLATLSGCGGGGLPGAGGAAGPASPRDEAISARTLGPGQAMMERSLAADRWIVFHTVEPLVPEDANGTYDVYLQDLESGLVTRISAGNRASYFASLSSDGNRIAYASDATDLVPGDTNGRRDIFLHDRAGGTTTRISLASTGAQSTGTSTFPVITADGGQVVFVSDGKLVPEKTTSAVDVFVRDLTAGTTTLLTRGLTGNGGNGASSTPALTGDGRYVAFVSAATNLVPGDTNGAADVFVLDRDTATLERVSTGPGGVQGNGACSQPSISDDGRLVAYDSIARNLVPGDANLKRDVFLRDRGTGSTARVSVSSAGAEGNGDSSQPTLSRDGTLLAFASSASNLVASDGNGLGDVFWLPVGGEVRLGSSGSAASDQPVWGSGGLAFRTSGAGSPLTVVRLVPQAPTSVVATPGAGSVTLTWPAVPGAETYEVYVDEAVLPIVTTSLTQATLAGLVNGQSYGFTVRARNVAGLSAPSTPTTATPLNPAPAAPTGLAATGGDTVATLTWSPVTGAASYDVHFQGSSTRIGNTTGTSYQVSGLTNLQTYSFVVFARSAGGVSEASAPVTVTLDSPGNAMWTRRAGGTASDIGSEAAVGPDGTLYVTGSFQDTAQFGTTSLTSAGGFDGFVAAVNPATGAVLWAVRTGSSGHDSTVGITATSAGVFVAGYYTGTMTGFGSGAGASAATGTTNNGFVAALNPATGAPLWAVRTGGTQSTLCHSIAADGSRVYVGGYYMGTPSGFAATVGTSAGSYDAFVAALNPATGAAIWAVRSGSTGADYGHEVARNSTGVYVTGYYSGGTMTGFGASAGAGAGLTDAYVAALNPSSGAALWAKRTGVPGATCYGQSVAATDTGLYVTGYYNGTLTGFAAQAGASNGNDAFVAALNPSTGASVWARNGGDVGLGIAANSSRVFASGYFQGVGGGFLQDVGTSAGSADAYVAALDAATGTNVWARRAGQAGSDVAQSLAATGSALFAVGYFNGTPTGFLTGVGSSAGSNEIFWARLMP